MLTQLVPEQLNDLLTSLLTKKPAERMSSIAELVRRLESLKNAGLGTQLGTLGAGTGKLLEESGREFRQPHTSAKSIAGDLGQFRKCRLLACSARQMRTIEFRQEYFWALTAFIPNCHLTIVLGVVNVERVVGEWRVSLRC